MKKIVILNSSLRKKSTYSLLKKVEAYFDDCEVEFVSIKDYDLKPCVGCENCLRKGNCNIKDEADLLLGKLREADGIVIGTPVYLRQISGYLKLLIDRGCAWYHRSPLVGKPILFVTTTQVTGSKQAGKYLEDVAIQWGVIHAGTISRTMFNLDKELKEKKLSKFLFYLDEDNRRKFRPGFKQLMEFHTQKVLAVNILPLDLVWWTEKGYISKPYYYPCRINIFMRILGYFYYRMLNYFISKNKTESVDMSGK